MRGCADLLVSLVLDRLIGADSFSELCESDQMLSRASTSFPSPDASSWGRNALFGGVSGMNTKGAAWAGNCCCFCAGLVTTLATVHHFSDRSLVSYRKYNMPPVPTLLTVKLLPALEFGGSSFLGSLDAFCDRSRKISVLFFTRLSELLLLLLPSLRIESFLAGFVFSSRVSGAMYDDGGFFDEAVVLEVFCDVLLRDAPVMCFATIGSTDMKDSLLTRDDVRGISTASVDCFERVCCPAQQLVSGRGSDTGRVAGW